jgi:YD repeat-containing protein
MGILPGVAGGRLGGRPHLSPSMLTTEGSMTGHAARRGIRAAVSSVSRLFRSKIDRSVRSSAIESLEQRQMLTISATPTFLYDASVGDHSPHKIQVVFGQDVGSSLVASDLLLDNVTTGEQVLSDLVLSYNSTTKTAIFSYDPDNDSGTLDVLPDGNYRAVITKDDVTSSGGGLTSDMVLDFFVLGGDIAGATSGPNAPRDRTIDFDDFIPVSQNYDLTGKTYLQGNWDYDIAGGVGFPELILYGQKSGMVLGAPPTGPNDISLSTLSPGSVTVNWVDASVGETGWRVQISDDGTDFSTLPHHNVRANQTSFNFTGLTQGQKYWFRVRAYSDDTLNPNGPDTAYTPKESLAASIAAPSIVSWTEPDSTHVSGEWTRVDSASSYNLYTVSGSTRTLVQNITQPSSGNPTYSGTRSTNAVANYQLVAVTADAESASVAISTPAAPTNVAAVVNSSNNFEVSWTGHSTAATGYSISRRTTVNGSWTTAGTVGSSTFTFEDTATLTDGTWYQYRVTPTVSGATPASAAPVSVIRSAMPISLAPRLNTVATVAQGAESGDPASFAYSPDTGVRYADGTLAYETTDLMGEGLGAQWGVTRSWSNNVGYAGNSEVGNGWMINQRPFIKIIDADELLLILSGTDSIRFQEGISGVFHAVVNGETLSSPPSPFRQDKIVLDDDSGSDHEYRMTTSGGRVIRFFAPGATGKPTGQLKSVDSLGTNTITYSSGDRVTDTFEKSGSPSKNESYVYEWDEILSGSGVWRIRSIEMHRKNGSADDIARRVEYTYYGAAEANGSLGDLKLAQIYDAGEWVSSAYTGELIDSKYYRYYKPGKSGEYASLLKMAFDSKSFARLQANVSSYDTSPDATVELYADLKLTYDAQHRVATATVLGKGSSWKDGRARFDYGYDVVSGKGETYEGGPVTSRIVYTEPSGEVRLDSLTDSSTEKTWSTYHEYDSRGRLTLTAEPSAISGTYGADLLNDPAGGSGLEGLRDNDGLIYKYTYGTTSNAPSLSHTYYTPLDIIGYLKNWSVFRGESDSTGQLLGAQTYSKLHIDYSDIGFIRTTTVYEGAGGTGALITKTDYDDIPSIYESSTSDPVPLALFKGMTVSTPIVSSTKNGKGGSTASKIVSTLDSSGRLLTVTDADGVETRYGYDDLTGIVKTTEIDSAGLDLETEYLAMDELGRPTKVRDPNGNITGMFYDDAARETRVYPGLHQESSVWKTTGPVKVTRFDFARGFYEELAFAPSSVNVDGNGVPTGGETIGTTMTALQRSYEAVSGMLTQVDNYHNLSSITYSASTFVLGAQNTNRYSSFYDYDTGGRLDREVNNVGTVTRYALDGIGHVLSKWIGTGDSVDVGEWVTGSFHIGFQVWDPTANSGAGGNVESTTLLANNMTMVAAYDYDDPNDAMDDTLDYGDIDGTGIGIGDGNVTKVTTIVGGGVADRVTHLHYDWRDRLVAVRSAVESSQSTSFDRPFTYYSLDNLGRATAMDTYDGDTITSVSYSSGVPVAPSSSLLRAHATTGYDELGQIYRESTFKVNGSGNIGDALQTNYWRSEAGRLMKTLAPGGLVTKNGYDAAGRLDVTYQTDGYDDTDWSDAQDAVGDHVLEQTEYTLDDNGNITFQVLKQRPHISMATGPLSDPPARPSTATPHTAGSAIRTYNTAYAYDAAARLTRVANIGANDGYFYDHTTSWSIPSRMTDPDFLVTDYIYDAAGYNNTTTDPRGIVNKTSHDALGRVTQTIDAYVDGTISDGDDRQTDYMYDGNNNVTLLTAYTTDSDYQQTAYLYGVSLAGSGASAISSNDLLSSVKYPNTATGDPGPAESTTYNITGQVVTSTDRNGTIHAYGYDVLGRLGSDTATTLGSGVDSSIHRLGYGYDVWGNTTHFESYSDTAGSSLANDVIRTYDSLGRLTNEHQASGSLNDDVSFTYDDTATSGVLDYGGRLSLVSYPDGRVLHYGYDSGLDDSISRLSLLADDDGTGDFGVTLEHLSYLGLSTTVVRSHSEALTDWSLAMRHTGSSTWADPNSTSTLDRNDGDLYAGLDNHGRVSRVRWDATDSSSYFDSTQGTAGERDDFSYGYDASGNRLYRTNNVNHAFDELYHADGASAGYDKLDRLTEFQRGTMTDANSDGAPDTVSTSSRSQNWTLDPLGNWKQLNGSTGGSPDATQTRAHNSQNAIDTVTQSSVTHTLTTSANGEMTKDDRGQTYTYDAWGRLKTVDPDGTATTCVATVYTYDALFRRVTEDADGSGSTIPTTHLYYSPAWQVIEERTENTAGTTETLAVQYVWSPVYMDAMVLQDRDRNADGDVSDTGERFYVQQDANFNVTALVGDTNSGTSGYQWGVVERYVEDPYGKPTTYDATFSTANSTSSFGNRYVHQGGRYDYTLLLDSFRFRDLHVGMGRWSRQDPLGYPDSANRFAALKSNPLVNWDIFGLRNPVAATDPRVAALQAYVALSLALAITVLIQSKNGNVAQGLNQAVKDGLLTAEQAAAILASHVLAKWLTDERHIADHFGIPRKKIGPIIHEIKRGTPHEGNPDIEVDEATGDIRIKGTDEIIDNIKNYD